MSSQRLVPDNYSTTKELGAYVITSQSLLRMEPLINALLLNGREKTAERGYRKWTVSGAGKEFEFDSASALLEAIDANHVRIENLAIFGSEGTHSERTSLSIRFESAGRVRLDAKGGRSLEFEHDTHKLEREIERIADPPGLLVSHIVWKEWLAFLASYALLLSAIYGLYFLLTFSKASEAVPIDETLVPKGYQHLTLMQDAIKSNSIEMKLDALLRAQLRGTVSGAAYITEKYRNLRLAGFVAFLAFLTLLFHAWAASLWPRSTLAVGANADSFDRLTKRRDIFVGSIVLGVLVNIGTGLFLMYI